MKKNTKKFFAVIVYSIILIFIQLPWFLIGEKRYTIYGLYSCAEQTGSVSMFRAQLIVLVLYEVFCICYLFATIINKNWYLNAACLFLGLVYLLIATEVLGNMVGFVAGSVYPNLLLVCSLIEFIIPKMAAAKKAAEEEARNTLLRDKQEKADEKRRLYFQGVYPDLFYRIIWKNFTYHWRDYILFILCGVLVSTLSLVGLGSYEMMAGIHSNGSFIIGTGLGQIVTNALFPISICTIVLMIYVLLFYLKKRMVSYGMFLVLGSRKKTLYIMMAIEFMFSLFCALAFGCIVGTMVLHLLQSGIVEFVETGVTLSSVTWLTYLKMFGVTAAVYLISLMGTRDIATDLNIISASARKVRGEKMPWKGLKLLTVLGVIAVVWSVFSYRLLQNYEAIGLLGVYFAGIFLVIRYGMAAFLNKAKKGKKYLERLMDRNYLYQKSRTTAWYLLALSFLSTCAVFYFTLQAVSVTLSDDVDTLFPYDFMCIVDQEDDQFFQELQDQYNLEMVTYPMVRVSSSDGRPGIESPGAHSPQGQNIGISETTYHMLKKAVDTDYQSHSLGLDDMGEKIFIVHQQDRSIQAQPIDWQFNRSKLYLHIGAPCIYYSKTAPHRINGYPPHEIAGEEIESLTGGFRQGRQENLVVFSDQYFEKAQDMWKYTDIRTGMKIEEKEKQIPDVTIRQGMTKLVLIKAQESDLNNLEEEMKTLEQMPNHVYEAEYNTEVCSYYSKKTAVYDLKTEQMMRLIVNSAVIVTLMVTYIFLISVKVFSEMDDKIKRAAFLKTMGMYRKERVRMLKKELYPFFWVPAFVTVISTVCFTAAAFHARMYTDVVARECLSRAVWIWGICLIIEGLVVRILGALVIHKVEGVRN